MLFDSGDRDPYFGDEIKHEAMAHFESPDTPLDELEYDVPEIENEELNEVCEMYDCWDLLPVAGYIKWLAMVKEALGYIPKMFRLTYEEIRLLVVYQEESNKKMMYDSYKMRQVNEQSQSQSQSQSID